MEVVIVSIIIGIALWYSFNHLFNVLDNRTPKAPKRDKELERAISIINLPFKITVANVYLIERLLFYAGVFVALAFLLFGKWAPALIGFAVFFVASTFTKRFFYFLSQQTEKRIVKDLPIFLDAFIGLISAGSRVDKAFEDCMHISKPLAKQFEPVLRNWYNPSGPTYAIKLLERSNIRELNSLAGLFIQLVRGSEHALDMLVNQKHQIAEINHLKTIRDANRRPVYYTLMLMFPFGAAVISWFYPLIISVVEMFDGFLIK